MHEEEEKKQGLTKKDLASFIDKWKKDNPKPRTTPRPRRLSRGETNDFIEVWNSSKSVAQAAEAFSITPKQAHSRAAYWREKSYSLKHFPTSRSKEETNDFIEVWNSSKSVAQAAEVFSMTKKQASTRASYLRSRGFDLKLFHPTNKKHGGWDDEKIIEVWNSSKSPDAAAQRLGITAKEAARRASYLRSQGADVKRYRPKLKSWSNEDFIKIWNSSESPDEAAQRLEIPKGLVVNRASRLRQKGFDVKYCPKLKPWSTETENFIKIWNSSESPDEAAKALSIPRGLAVNRASRLRQKGFDVKYFV